jgi:hypothetical protein
MLYCRMQMYLSGIIGLINFFYNVDSIVYSFQYRYSVFVY